MCNMYIFIYSYICIKLCAEYTQAYRQDKAVEHEEGLATPEHVHVIVGWRVDADVAVLLQNATGGQ